MRNPCHILALSSYITLACSGTMITTGCAGSGKSQAELSDVSLEIRFQDGDGGQAQPSTNVLRLATVADAGPTTHDNVARVLVDISIAATGQPFFTNFELTKLA